MVINAAVLVVCLAGMLLLPVGCSKSVDNPVQTLDPALNGRVADMMAASLAGGSSTHGAAAQMEGATVVAGGGGFPKTPAATDLRSFDTTIVREGGSGSYTYHYEFHFSIAFLNFGNRLNFNYAMYGTYHTPKISSIDSATSAIVVTHILDADTEYTVNSTYTRKGLQSLNEMFLFSSTVAGTTTDIKIGKAAHRINSGAAVYTVSGRTAGGASFSFTAVVTFLGNNQALLVLDGVPYAIDLAAGTATPIGS